MTFSQDAENDTEAESADEAESTEDSESAGQRGTPPSGEMPEGMSEGEMPEMPEGMTPPEGMTMPEDGSMPDFSGGFGGMGSGFENFGRRKKLNFHKSSINYEKREQPECYSL